MPSSVVSKFSPVRLPPGRARLEISPTLTRSPPAVKTTGMLVVAAFAASAVRVPPVETMRSTFCPTNSAANSGRRSVLPSAHLALIMTFCPSI